MRARLGHALECRHRLLRAILLDESDHRIENHNDDDGDGVFDIAHDASHDCRTYQHDDHEICKLV